MVSYNQANGGSVGVFCRHGMVSGLWGEIVLFQGMRMKFKDKIVLQGYRKRHCEYDPATGVFIEYMMFQVNCSEGSNEETMGELQKENVLQ